MSHEQCTRHWSIKKEKKGLKCKTSKCECDPNAHLEGKKEVDHSGTLSTEFKFVGIRMRYSYASNPIDNASEHEPKV